jgi:hypothetical protein
VNLSPWRKGGWLPLFLLFIKKYAEDVGRKPEDESIPAEGWK